jgi:hypothetical protein
LRRGGEGGDHRGSCLKRNTKFVTELLKENCEDMDNVLELPISLKFEFSAIETIAARNLFG